MKKTTIALKLCTIFMIFLILTMPISYALSIKPETIKAEVDKSKPISTISWETDDLSSGIVRYGKSTESISTIPETGEYKQSHSVVLNDLEYGQKYYYTIESSDGVVTAKLTGWKDFTTILSPVQNVKVDETSSSTATLSWQKLAKAKKYNIYLAKKEKDEKNSQKPKEFKSSEFKLNASGTYTTLDVNNLEPKTAYIAKVVGVDELEREGLFSDEIEFTTKELTPEISFVQAVSVTKNSAIIKWNSNLPTSSKVMYDKDSTLDLSAFDGALATDHSLKLKELQEGATYYFMIVVDKGTDETTGGTGSAGNIPEIIAQSEVKSFTTLKIDTALEFIDISASEITKQQATITWRTNLEEKCAVFYGIDDSFTSSKKEDLAGTEHKILLNDLLTGIKYYYKIKCGAQESAVNSFITLAGEEGEFLTLNQIPMYTTTPTINITGKVTKNSKLYIFLNDDPLAKVHKIINSTSFSEEILLNFASKQDGISGKNIIKVLAWDPTMKKDTKLLSTIVDIVKPSFELNELPDAVNENTLNVSGIGEPNATIDIFVNNQTKAHLTIGSDGSFWTNVALGNQNQSITVIAKDKAGNEQRAEKLIVVDKLAPKIDILTQLKAETHFKILTIEGKTKPNSKLYVTNYGEFNGCDDIQWIKMFGECTTWIGKKHRVPGTMVSYSIDPIGLVLGSTIEASADNDGRFTIRVPLFMSTGLKVSGKNRIEFLASDNAGNIGTRVVNINYKPGCPDWQINLGEIQSYPFNLYTKDFTDNNVEASTFIPIEYLGSGNPRNIRVSVVKDINSIHEGILGNTGEVIEQDDGTDLINLRTAKFSQFDPIARKIYVYAPITINRYTGSIKQLPDQLNIYLKARISYRSDDAGYYGGTYTGSYFGQMSPGYYPESGYATCDVYPVISYSIQKPIDYSIFLTPEMINKTIQALDKTIDTSKKISNVVKEAALYTMLGCGAMVAYNYLSAAFTSVKPTTAGACSPVEEQMQTTYWLCDRILCPSAPARCEEKSWAKSGYLDGDSVVSEEEWNERGTTNDQTKLAYANAHNIPVEQMGNPTVASPTAIQAWASENNMKYYSGLKDQPRIYTYTDELTDEVTTFEYIDIKDRNVVDKKALSELTKSQGTPIINLRISEADIKAGDCDMTDQTLVRVRKASTEDLTPFSGAKKIVSPDYFCHPQSPDQLGEPDPSFLGCYSENCPNFDQTKCFWTADINPPAGLWASTRCGCLPGIKSHLDNLIRIMEGAKKCLQQAQIGEVRGGFCERLLAQFICDLFTELILKSLIGVGSDDYGIIGSAGGREGISDFKKNSRQVSKQLSNRYGGIVKNKLGLSSDQLVNKFCIAAITMDWSVLEGMLNQVVDAIPVEPIAHVEADSRAYGYDPFNGRMNIGYNIYLGLVPGGRTQTEMYLECDPSYPNPMCKAGERKPVPRSFRQLDKHYPPIDENIVFVDQNAQSWYNKLVFIMKYELAGDIKTEIIEVPITKKGDLAFGCTFSVTQGITCQTLGLIEQEAGIVQAYPVGAGSFLSPKTNTFFIGNKVNLMLRVRNQFKEPEFYVRFNFDDPSMSPLEYTLPGAGGGEVGSASQSFGEQVYNLWLGTVGSTGLGLSSGEQYNMNNIDFTLDEPIALDKKDGVHSNGRLNMQVICAEKAILNIYAQIKTQDNQFVDLEPFKCTVWGNDKSASEIYLQDPTYSSAVRINGQLVSKQKGITSQLGQEATTKTNDELAIMAFSDVQTSTSITINQNLVGDSSASNKEGLKTKLNGDNALSQSLKDKLVEIIDKSELNVKWVYSTSANQWETENIQGTVSSASSTPFSTTEFTMTNEEMAKLIELLGSKGMASHYFDFYDTSTTGTPSAQNIQIDNYKNWLLLKYAQKTGKPVAQVTTSEPDASEYEERLEMADGLYTKCLIPGDTLQRKFGVINPKAEAVKGDQVIIVRRITANVIQKQEYMHLMPTLRIVSGSQQAERQFTKISLPQSTDITGKTVGVTMTLLKDTNNNGQGDTPLLYEGKPQQFKFNYYIKETPKTNLMPMVDIIEPVTEYVNDFEELWIGANILDDKNKITEIKLRIVNSKSKKACESEFSVDASINVIGDPNKNSCGVDLNRLARGTENLLPNELSAPSFIRFKINLQEIPASTFFTPGDMDYYAITLDISDGESVGKSSKGFKIVSKPSIYSYATLPPGISSQGMVVTQTPSGGNILCLGSGACAVWGEPHYPAEVILDPSIPNQEQLQDVVPGQFGAPNLPPSQTSQEQYDYYGNQWAYNPNMDYSQPFQSNSNLNSYPNQNMGSTETGFGSGYGSGYSGGYSTS